VKTDETERGQEKPAETAPIEEENEEWFLY
jgi:hypothetical protein